MNRSTGRRTTWVAGFVLAASVVGTGGYLWWSLRDWGLGGLGLHGMLALLIGALGMLALAGGLMFLVFYSARTGHDDRAHDDRTHEPPSTGPDRADDADPTDPSDPNR